jgi:pectin methylesterase-like acyl-CoA thioesterase
VFTVAKDGSGQYRGVPAAVDSIAKGSTAPVLIRIKAGTYKEQLTIADRQNITLCGDDPNTTILTFDTNSNKAGSLDNGASVRISASNFSAANLTFQNSSPLGSAQAVAVVTSGQRQQFSNCRFLSYQATLYTKTGTQYFRDCFVQGNTDYVFRSPTAVLHNCNVHRVSKGTAVAAPRTEAGTPYGIVFIGGKLTAASGVPANSVALGRPWGPRGAATYINVNLGGHISKEGWVQMSGNPVNGARFAEYRSTGSGASPNTRAAGSRQLSESEASRYTVSGVLGWTPSYSR